MNQASVQKLATELAEYVLERIECDCDEALGEWCPADVARQLLVELED